MDEQPNMTCTMHSLPELLILVVTFFVCFIFLCFDSHLHCFIFAGEKILCSWYHHSFALHVNKCEDVENFAKFLTGRLCSQVIFVMSMWTRVQPAYAANMWNEALNKRLGTEVLFLFLNAKNCCAMTEYPFIFPNRPTLHHPVAWCWWESVYYCICKLLLSFW